MRDKIIAISFLLVLCVVAADGILLMLGKHGEAINRFHAVIGNPERVDVEKFKAMPSRIGGVGVFAISLYVVLSVLKII